MVATWAPRWRGGQHAVGHLAFSLGGMVAQALVLEHPYLVRRHGAIFQYHQEFAPAVVEFLGSA